MQTLWLEVFRQVVRSGSITAAARALGYTQSAVSRHIAALEDEYGVRLLDRLPRGVALTDAGALILEHAEPILQRVGEARRDVAGLQSGQHGRLRVGAFPTAVAALVPRALQGFRRDHPAVSVSLVEGTTPRILNRLAHGDADIAVVSADPDAGPGEDRFDGFDLVHVLDERMLVAVPRHHRLAGRRVVALADLADDPFIVGSALDDPGLLRAHLPAHFRPRVDIVVADWTGKLGCVAAGLGVALLPALAVPVTPPNVRVLRLRADDAPQRRVFVATNAGRTTPHTVGPFVDHLHAVAGTLNGTTVARPHRRRHSPGGGATA